MNTTDIIDISPSIPTGAGAVSVSIAAEDRQRELLNLCAGLPAITSSQSANAVADFLREVKTFTKLIESSRNEVKAPLLALGKAIDAKAKELTYELEDQIAQIGRNLATWQQLERSRIEEAARAARIEEARIRRETQEKLDAAAARYKTDAGLERATAKIEDKAMAAIMETRAPVNELGAQRVLGVATRTEIRVEVTDIKALYAAFPHCVKLEVNLALLKATIKSLGEGAVVPGVTYYKEATTHVR